MPTVSAQSASLVSTKSTTCASPVAKAAPLAVILPTVSPAQMATTGECRTEVSAKVVLLGARSATRQALAMVV
jgi:hypothetical protein